MSGLINQSVQVTDYLYPSVKPVRHSQMTALGHYVIASALFALYGGQVCPLLDNITLWQLFLPLMVAFGVREMLTGKVRQQPLHRRVAACFCLDLALFLITAVAIVLINLYLYQSPWHSNLKVLFGLSTLGTFVAVDLALLQERQLAYELIQARKELELGERASSFVQKFATMAAVMLVTIAMVLFLVVNKDLDWLLEEGIQLTHDDARNSILKEFAFVTLVILGYAILIIRRYASNMSMYLSFENNVLKEVAGGNLKVRVPVASQDEFGAMARGTNAMVSSLLVAQNNLKETRDATIVALASLAEARDNETGAHIKRTQYYVKALADHMSRLPEYQAELTPQTIDLIFKAAPLHDIGKVGIPDSILLKPGKLTDDEFVIMKTHAQLGADALQEAVESVSDNAFLRHAQDIAANHHEKWDGSGYPMGKSGEQIPLSARLMALADVYDALISKRVYKPAFSHDKAKGIILEGAGRHFDPQVIEAFLACEEAFVEIAQIYQDKH